MIDCESEVYSRVATKLRESFPNINLSGEYVRSPASFPHASIVMSDNAAMRANLDSSGKENMALVTFEVNVYSNKSEGKKTECKNIAKNIDETLFSMNFLRLVMTPVPNMEDATIYRIVARYQAKTDGKFFYRR